MILNDMGGLIELGAVAIMLVLGWAILEWQGRRLDRKRAEREQGDKSDR
jgi:hypothetical protein